MIHALVLGALPPLPFKLAVIYFVGSFFFCVALFLWLLDRSQGAPPEKVTGQRLIWYILRRYWPLGVRAQLMIGYTIVAAFMTILSVAGFLAIIQPINVPSDTLITHADSLAAHITFDGAGRPIPPALLPPSVALTKLNVPQSPPAYGYGDYRNVDLVYITDNDGNPIYISPAFTTLQFYRESIDIPLQHIDVKWDGYTHTFDQHYIHIYSRQLYHHDGKLAGIIEVGQPDVQIQFVPPSQIVPLLLPILGALGILASYWLASRAFRPIHRLTETALSITGGDLRQRVPLPAARDDMRRLAMTFNSMLDRLDDSFSQQRRFVADASHELRTPVAVIRSMTDVALAQDTATRDEYAGVLHDVNAESERLGKLINQLLALVRTDDGQMRLDHEPVRLDLLASDVLSNAAALAEERGITLTCDALVPVTVLGDMARLIQVIMSLVDNALTYTNTGGFVSVAVAVTELGAVLSVTDTGIGIDPGDLPHVFERFYRADRARSRAGGGSGLGLALADGIVRAHAGNITVESVPGRGSTFSVTLPPA